MLFVALFALCVAFQGEVSANNSTINNQSLIVANVSGEVDPTVLEYVFEVVSVEKGLSVESVQDMYMKGEMTVEEEGEVYTARTADGGVVEIVLGETF